MCNRNRMMALLCFAFLMCLLAGCTRADVSPTVRQMPPEEAPAVTDVSVTIKEGSLSADEAVLVVESSALEHVYNHGHDFGLERYEDGQWVDMFAGVDREIALVGYQAWNNSSREFGFRWSDWIGSLPAGEYRVAVSVIRYPLDVERQDQKEGEYTLYARFSL